MKKDLDPQVFNYNKYPGPTFQRQGNQVLADNIQLEILVDVKEAFQTLEFGQRFSQWLLTYDYIVGDWGNGQLRLKGFYKDNRKDKSYATISHLEDYLLEYCNFGCAYFVLGNAQPIVLESQVEDFPRKRKRRRKRPSQGGQLSQASKEDQRFGIKKLSNKEKDKSSSVSSKKKPSSRPSQTKERGFVIRQR